MDEEGLIIEVKTTKVKQIGPLLSGTFSLVAVFINQCVSHQDVSPSKPLIVHSVTYDSRQQQNNCLPSLC